MTKCSETNLCEALAKRCHASRRTGFVQINYTCMSDGSYRGSLLIYCKSKDDVGVTLNFCPFCGFEYHLVYRKGKRLSLNGEPKKKKRRLKVSSDE